MCPAQNSILSYAKHPKHITPCPLCSPLCTDALRWGNNISVLVSSFDPSYDAALKRFTVHVEAVALPLSHVPGLGCVRLLLLLDGGDAQELVGS